MKRATAVALSLAMFAGLATPGVAAQTPRAANGPSAAAWPAGIAHDPATGSRTFPLGDGTAVRLGRDGLGYREAADGRPLQPVAEVVPNGPVPALTKTSGPSDLALARRFARRNGGPFVAGQLVVVFRNAVDATRLQAAFATRKPSAPLLGDGQLGAALDALRPVKIRPLFGTLPAARVSALAAAARAALGANALDLTRAYVLNVTAGSPSGGAHALRALPGIAYASPNFRVDSMMTDPNPIPERTLSEADAAANASSRVRSGANGTGGASAPLPTNYGYLSSEQSYLNTNAVDVAPAWEALAKASEIPGQGERITNVSIGDLTDASMAAGGDLYVQANGPTTVIRGGQRFLDFPGLPLIPTYVADGSGNLDPLGSAEVGDPNLGEILLDFSVMAPLPNAQQRPAMRAHGFNDLLGIAPGAQYRLVAPQQPDYANIDAALVGAAAQQPQPNVITASLGYGTDAQGFPGRYLEDDPLTRSVVAAIVQLDRVVVCIASNDGTRLYTNAAVNPDGGSTPTDLANGAIPTTVAEDADTTTPSLVPDSGAIAVGGTTLDDIVAVPPQAGGPLSVEGTFAETRIDGSTDFSSGFGSRVDVSAPSDNVASLLHVCKVFPNCSPSSVIAVLNGGTSAAAPMTAAAAAVVLQAARLAGKSFEPKAVRALLARTGREPARVPQIDRPLHVGPQIDVGAAVTSLLVAPASAYVARVAVAQRRNVGNLAATFTEDVDPAKIDLAGPSYNGVPSGQNAVSPLTFAPDWIGLPAGTHFALFVTGKPSQVLARTKWARLLPGQIFAAAGMPLASSTPRTVSLTYRATAGTKVAASTTFALTFSADDGTYVESLAPVAPAVANAGDAVKVSYDLSHVRGVVSPYLYVTSIGHWNFVTAPYFREQAKVPLPALKGTVTVPASAFVGGGGIYGIGLITAVDQSGFQTGGEIAPIRIAGVSNERPQTPLLSSTVAQAGAPSLIVDRASPGFALHYDTSTVKNASGAILEISSAGPTVQNLWNVFTNAFGTRRDDNGVETKSTLYRKLAGNRGAIELNAQKLGLASSLFYTLRVLPAQGDTVVGEASPVAGLEYDDRLAPGGAAVTSFSIATGGPSTVGTVTSDANGFITGSSAYRYDPLAESYGTSLASDPTGTGIFYLFGTDTADTAVVREPLDTSAAGTIDTFDNASNGLVSSVNYPGNFAVYSGKTDPARHKLALVGEDVSAFTSEAFSFAIDTQMLGPAIPVTSRANMVDIDPSNGTAFVGVRAGECAPPFTVGLQAVDLAASKVTASTTIPTCVEGIASDQNGGKLYIPHGGLFNPFGPPFPSGLITASESPLKQTGSASFVDRAGYFPAYDATNKLLLVAYVAPSDYEVNNSATGLVDEYDMANGAKLVKQIKTFDFTYPLTSGFAVLDGGLQLDPATRTGWTFGPLGNQVQRFTY